MAESFKKSVYDTIHGFIKLTDTEYKIVSCPYFQRLRWIRQLGWSHYIYPGASHSRFAHALGVLHVMDRIVRQLGRGVDESKLYNMKVRDEGTLFHRKMRLAAMLHDIGTFPFSHSIEYAYIEHYKKQLKEGKRPGPANHEELGSHIINHTDFEGGITSILKEAGIDPKEMSELIRGKSSSVLANQLIHSDIDADRIDYLVRDAHFTGVKYGVFDTDYLISNMRVVKDKNREVLAIYEGALTAVEYFLISRYTWYSQIINDGTGYKFDLLSTKIAEYFIENGMIYNFEELKTLAAKKPNSFFGFNDSYFTAKLQEGLDTGDLAEVSTNPKRRSTDLKHISPKISEYIEMLMFRSAPQQLKIGPFEPSLVQNSRERKGLIHNIHNAVEWLREKLKNVPSGWVLEDIPAKDVIFTKGADDLRAAGGLTRNGNGHLAHSAAAAGPKGSAKLAGRPVSKPIGRIENQDSVRMVDRDGNIRLLVDIPNSIVRILSGYQNFIPRVYVSRNTYRYLQSKGLLKQLEEKFNPTSASKKKRVS
jgi:uncharacterized protein